MLQFQPVVEHSSGLLVAFVEFPLGMHTSPIDELRPIFSRIRRGFARTFRNRHREDYMNTTISHMK